MKLVRSEVVLAAVGLMALPLASQAQTTTPAPTTESLAGGATKIVLDPAFLTALQGLSLKVGAFGSGGWLLSSAGQTGAYLSITTGVFDEAAMKGEISHSGGLSLTSGANVIDLSSFIIQIYPNPSAPPVLTGLWTANGKFAGRIPLFDLTVDPAQIKAQDPFLSIANVALTLDPAAASALSQAFGATVQSMPAGTATITGVLSQNQ